LTALVPGTFIVVAKKMMQRSAAKHADGAMSVYGRYLHLFRRLHVIRYRS